MKNWKKNLHNTPRQFFFKSKVICQHLKGLTTLYPSTVARSGALEAGAPYSTVALRKNSIWWMLRNSPDKMKISRFFSPKFPENFIRSFISVSDTFKGEYVQLSSKINILPEEMWRHLNVHTSFSLSAAVHALDHVQNASGAANASNKEYR